MENFVKPVEKPVVAMPTQMKMAKYIPADTNEIENREGWIDYGTGKKRFPDYLIRKYHTAPIHGPLVTGMARRIAGKGIDGVPISKKDHKALCLDLKLQGGFFATLIPNLGGDQINKIEHLPFERCQLATEDEDGNIIGIWYSRDWRNHRKPINKPKFIPLATTPYSEWKQEDKKTPHVIWGFLPTPGTGNYPKPDYITGINWIESSQGISEYHVNNILNGFFASFIITMIDAETDPDKRAALKQMFESVTGAENAGRVVFLWTDNEANAPKITAAHISDADKQYVFLSEECFKQIMFAHLVASPLLFGIRDSGGGLGSNKDEMKEAERILMQQVISPFQEIIIDTYATVGYVASIIQNDPLFPDTDTTETSNIQQTKLSKQADPTESDETIWLNHLENCGEKVSLDEWELKEEVFVDSLDEPTDFRMMFSAEERSKWGDAGLYKLRYRYSTNITDDSRKFCKRMVNLSVAGVMYRKEDIDLMSDSGVNGQFSPEGQTSYDIFEWKGGVYCHHKWVRLIFVRRRGEDGKILPASKTPDLENDKRVANNPYVPKKGDEGVAPIDTASRGSLKHG